MTHSLISLWSDILIIYKVNSLTILLDAYEIRMPDDDDSGKADMGFAAIEKSRSILSTQSQAFCLIETPGF